MTNPYNENSENWWRGATLYQVYPRSFQDSNADGIGDLPGITRRLPEIKALGVDGIWISPFFKSPMKDFGYDVSDYTAVDPMFGTMDDFDTLVKTAHDLGLKIVIDQVLSHTADVHAWFKESRSSRDNAKADWYVWAEAKEDGTPPNNWLSVFGGSSWEWDSRRLQYYLHNFLTSQPDLNFHNVEVQDAILASSRFWLERGVDGVRLDTIPYYFHDKLLRDNPPAVVEGVSTVPSVNPYGRQKHNYDKTQPENLEFLKRYRLLLNEFNAFAVGEVGDEERSLKTMADYTSDNDKIQMCYSFELLGDQFSPQHIRNNVEGFFSVAKDGWPCWAFSNHDVGRHVSRWSGTNDPQDTAKFCIALLASLRGSLCLYQGEELGLTEAVLTFEEVQDPYGIRFWPDFKGRDGCRTPYPWDRKEPNAGFSEGKPWLPVSEEHLAHSYVQETHEAGSVLGHYRTILKARNASEILLRGDIKFLEGTNDVLAFERTNETGRILCVFNFGSRPVTQTIAGDFEGAKFIDSFTRGVSVKNGVLELDGLGFALLSH